MGEGVPALDRIGQAQSEVDQPIVFDVVDALSLRHARTSRRTARLPVDPSRTISQSAVKVPLGRLRESSPFAVMHFFRWSRHRSNMVSTAAGVVPTSGCRAIVADGSS